MPRIHNLFTLPRLMVIAAMVGVLAIMSAYGTASANHDLVETFNTNTSDTAATLAAYPDWSATGSTASNIFVSGKQLNMIPTGGGNNVLFDVSGVPGNVLINADIGTNGFGPIGYNVGISIGSNRLVFHPGLTGGSFRVEGAGGYGGESMGFDPAANVMHHFNVSIDGSTKLVTIKVTDGNDPSNVYNKTFTATNYNPGISRLGFRIEGGNFGGQGFFDNFSIAGPVGDFTIEQAAGEISVEPLKGTTTAEAFFSYAGASANTGFEESDASLLFLHQDPNGEIALVIIHDKATNPDGGEATFTFSGVPTGTDFVLRDDSSGTEAVLPSSTWKWNGCCTDGGVLKGTLDEPFELTITPDFVRGINTWKFLTGSMDAPAAVVLDKGQPITIRMTAVNFLPEARNDSATTDEDQDVDIDVLSNDLDHEGGSFGLTGVTQGANGTVTVNGDGTVNYTPDPDFSGSDMFEYTIAEPRSHPATCQEVRDADPAAVDGDYQIYPNGNSFTVYCHDMAGAPSDYLTLPNIGGDFALSEPFRANKADTAATLAGYPEWSATGSTATNVYVANRRLNMNPTGAGNTTLFDVPGVPGNLVMRADIGATAVGAGGFNVGISIGSNRLVFHPGFGHGSFRVEGAGGYGGESMGFNPAGDVMHHFAVTIDAATKLVTLQVTDGNNAANVYSRSFTATNYNPGISRLGFQIEGWSGAGRAGFFDNVHIVEGSNFSQFTAGGDAPGTDVRTNYTRVRLNPVDLTVDIGDQTFSNSTGFVNRSGGVTSMPYGVAMACISNFNDAGVANIDLRGTPFFVDDTFTVFGFNRAGSSTFGSGDQVVDITGGGYCGWNTPSPWMNNPINSKGGFRLDLGFNGPSASPDPNGPTSTAKAFITVLPVNDAPVAFDDNAETDQEQAVDIDVLANDTDIDGDLLAVTGVTQGANGTVTVNADGTVNYTPNPGFSGPDMFEYTVADFLPGSCEGIRALDPGAVDGAYQIYPNGNSFTVYCHDMAGTPSEYLTLVNTGGNQDLLEKFQANTADTAATLATYPAWSATGSTASNIFVAGRRLNMVPNGAGNNILFDVGGVPGNVLLKAEIGTNGFGPIGYNVGISIGSNRLVFHPGLTGGSFRVEGAGGYGGENMGFNPAANVMHHFEVSIDAATKLVTIKVTDGNDASNVYNRTFTATKYDPGVSRLGFRIEGGNFGGQGFFDNFHLIEGSNYSQFTEGGAWRGTDVRTNYTRVRLHPVDLTVDIGDQTFATSTGTVRRLDRTDVTSMPYGVAMDCISRSSDTGIANIDLVGTPFFVDDTFTVGGYFPGGSSTFRSGDQVVDITGGGHCGWNTPSPSLNNPVNSKGGFRLDLGFNGPSAPPGFNTSPGLSATGKVFVTVIPVNNVPSVSATNLLVTVEEGQQAINDGAFDDLDSNDDVTISPSVGTVSQIGTQTGTWEWSFDSADGPDESQTVTITADDGTDTSTVDFELVVENAAPDVASDSGLVTVVEGEQATNSGTFADSGSDDVTISSSVGTVSQIGTQTGTWEWSFDSADGPDESQTVTITADDGTDTSTVDFELVVNNAAPDVITGDDVTIMAGESITSRSSFSDLGAGDGPWGYNIDWDDGTNLADTTADQNVDIVAIHAYPIAGVYNVTVEVTDKDSDPGNDTQVVTVLSADAAAEALTETIGELGLPAGTVSALTGTLDNAAASFAAGNVTPGTNQMEAFIKKIEAQRGKKISEEDADALIDLAERIIAAAA